MTHGLPDFYRGVDIAYQALAEMITRPKYGAAQIGGGTTLVGASAETDLVTVAGKGMLYGGLLYFTYTSTQRNSKPTLYIDDVKIAEPTLLILNGYSINTEHAHSIYELFYDDAAFAYAVGISHGITFETSFKLSYNEVHGTTPSVTYNINYALI